MKIVPDSIKTVFVRKKLNYDHQEKLFLESDKKSLSFSTKWSKKIPEVKKKSVKLSQNGFLRPK